MVMWLACLALQIFAIHHCKSCNFCIYVGHIVLLYTTMICGVHTILCSTTWGYQLCSLEIRPLKWVLSSDEFEPEFSSSSRAELWRFWAEPCWAELGHFNFGAETELTILTISKHSKCFVPTPKLQSYFLIFMNICKTIDIFRVEYYDL